MMELRHGTLTSDGSGDATVTTTPSVTGRLVKVEVMNSSTSKPSDNWDLVVYTGTYGGNDMDILLVDATVSYAVTTAQVYYPLKVASKAADGSSSTLSEVSPVVFSKEIKVIGANMGDTKIATVLLIFEV